MKILAVSAVISVLLFADARSQVAPPIGWGTLTWYQQSAETVLANSRGIIEPTLSEDERTLARSIRYRVTASPGAGAFATYEDHRRLVVISAGIVQLMEWLAEAIIYDDDLGQRGCFQDYSKYLGEQIIENTERNSRGLPPRVAVNVLGYAQQFGDACKDINPREFMSRNDLGAYRARMIEASIMFLYLHELGHHILGHTDAIRDGRQSSVEMHRAQEDAADRWAIKTAFGANYNLLAAMPIFSFIALTGGNSLESERKMDHPLGLRRFLTLYDEVYAHFKADPTSWHGSRPFNDMMAEISAQRAELKRRIDSLQ
jgi:hypothetical protein